MGQAVRIAHNDALLYTDAAGSIQQRAACRSVAQYIRVGEDVARDVAGTVPRTPLCAEEGLSVGGGKRRRCCVTLRD